VQLWSADHFGGVFGHGPADVGGVEQPLVVDRQFAQVTEVLDIQVGGERAHELGWFPEGVGEGVRRPWRDRDARPCLDIDALKIVAEGVNRLRSPERSMIVITHYQRLLEFIVPDVVHVLAKGKVVKTGGKELALELEAKGYAQFAGEAA